MNVTEKRPLKKILLAAGTAVAVLLILLVVGLLAFPTAVPAEPTEAAELPSPSPVPTPEPTPEPTPAAVLNREDSIYYRFDPALFAADSRGRITYTGTGYTCLTGIDVSEHQYGIDWQQVAADGIDFAIIRSGYRGYTSGGLHEDNYFRDNIKGALAAGLKVGVYFFSQATSVREAQEEAAFVLDQLKGYDVALPVVFDMEILSTEYRTYNLSRRALFRCTRAFCDAVAEAGYKPMIYMTQFLGYQKYTLRELTDYGFWYAEYYVGYPTFVYDFDVWQYSDTGTVAGIEGNVDLDLYLLRSE